MNDETYTSKLAQADDLQSAAQYAESEAVLHEALEAYPNDPELLLRLGMAQFMTSSPAAVQSLEAAAAAAPDDPSVLFRAAHLLFHLDEFASASRLAKAAARNTTDEFELRWSLVHLSGRLAAQQGKLAFAEQWLTAAFEEEPETTGHGQVLAEFLAAQGRRDEALRVARVALGHRPGDERLERLVLQLTAD